jgi:CMP-N-acetylneuraminic acid synthetase
VAAFRARDAGSAPSAVVSVGPAPQHPAWCFRLHGDQAMEPFLGWEALQCRSQDLQPAYALNGSIYVLPAALVRGGGALLQPGTRAFVMADPRESLDIDTADDWAQAQATHWERA